MIKKLTVRNYRLFEDFALECNDDLNIIVGNNESGKSTILEAINLALTRRLNGRSIDAELSSYLFNKTAVSAYVEALNKGTNPDLPRITIELYLDDRPELQNLRGTNNRSGIDSVGVKLEIAFDEDFREEYKKLIENPAQVRTIPTEYYRATWYSFADNALTPRSLPFGASYIDATTIRLQSGTDYYLQNIINSALDVKERVGLAVAFRKLKELFAGEQALKDINANLSTKRGALTDKDLGVGIDISQKGSWETSLTPHLDEIPFQWIGKGEQNSLKILLALDRKADESQVVLIEEPENHLSFSSMNALIAKIRDMCVGKQVFVSTHSAYVLNKLGLEKLILLNANKTAFLRTLSEGTQDYFKKLPGYDTLRLILAKRSILVEGPSDELVVQKAYFMRHGKLPIANGVDVISVRGLSFLRFLEIADELKLAVDVVTDNDGDYKTKVGDKYGALINERIRVYASEDNALPTLEPHLLAANSKELFEKLFQRSFDSDNDLCDYMSENKTECALTLFESNEAIKMPEYVWKAVEQE